VKTLILILLGCLSLNADVYLDAMKDEIKRSISKLEVKPFPKPYFISYSNYDVEWCEIDASFGDIRYVKKDRYNALNTDLRIGSSENDNSNYAYDLNSYRPKYTFLPIENDYDAIRSSIWQLTDEAYKEVIEIFSKKEAYRKKKDIKENYPSLSDEKTISYVKNVEHKKIDCDKFIGFIKNISSEFRKYEKIKDSSLKFYAHDVIRRFANSQGSEFVYPYEYYQIDLYVEMQDENGYLKNLSKSLIFTSEDEVLKYSRERILSFINDVSESYKSKQVDYYLGPAIFEEDASAEFFNNLFVKNISFYPPVETDKEEWLGYYYTLPKLVERIGKKVLPYFISIYDNPLEKDYKGFGLCGYYPVDDEGVVPFKLDLVYNGILKNIYSKRLVNKYSQKSNGHGRGDYVMYVSPMSGNVFVNSSKTLDYNGIISKAKEIAKENGLKEILVIKKISPPHDMRQLLGDPEIAYLLDIETGKKTYITASIFDGISLRTLRDILYTEDTDYVYNFMQRGPFGYRSGEVCSSIIVPRSILVGEVELIKSQEKPEKKPYVPHPYFGH